MSLVIVVLVFLDNGWDLFLFSYILVLEYQPDYYALMILYFKYFQGRYCQSSGDIYNKVPWNLPPYLSDSLFSGCFLVNVLMHEKGIWYFILIIAISILVFTNDCYFLETGVFQSNGIVPQETMILFAR